MESTTPYTTSNAFFVKDLEAFKKALIGHGIGVKFYGTFSTVSIFEQPDGRIRIQTQDPWAYLDQGYLDNSDVPEDEFRDGLDKIVADHIAEGESAVLIRDDRASVIVSDLVKELSLLDIAMQTAAEMRQAQAEG